VGSEPHAEDHDLTVGLEPAKNGIPRWAYAIAKRSHRIGEGIVHRIAAVPLQNDFLTGESTPPIPLGSDFWPFKREADVVVAGAAWAPNGVARERSEVHCEVGSYQKRIAVFGRRVIEWTTGGRPYCGLPEKFESIPLDNAHAYGGIDPRVPCPLGPDPLSMLRALGNHPGMYPRNPFGKGYMVVPERAEGVELPNLENPDDLLDDERLCLVDPRRWYRQPLPWTLGWHHAMMFPRYAFLGADAHLPVEDPSVLEEVRRGWLPADYRGCEDAAFQRRFYQEASLGMSFANLPPGTPIEVRGAHPSRPSLGFAIPDPPVIAIELEGRPQSVTSRLAAVVIEPAAERFSCVYLATTGELERRFVPGVHGEIPLEARVDNGAPARYDAPATWRSAT
jgi:hypothetical protein